MAIDGLNLIESALAFAEDAVVICERVSAPTGPLVLYVNGAFTHLTGYTRSDIVGTSSYLLYGSDDEERSVGAMISSLPDRTGPLRLRAYRKDGSSIWLDVSFFSIKDADGDVTHTVSYARDATYSVECEEAARELHAAATIGVELQSTSALRNAQAELAHTTCHDKLTGLPNRAMFFEGLESALRTLAPSGPIVAVLVIDCDRFKLVNDSFGHAVGDQLLVSIAERLETRRRREDALARFSGDEFTMLLLNVKDAAAVKAMAKRFLAAFAAPFMVNGHELYVTVSIGIALSTPGAEPADILRDADIAMYQAKRLGKNRCQLFTSELREEAVRKHLIEMDFRRALSQSQISVAYQPLISLETGRLRGFEALVRWVHPTLGTISPDEFIPIAEETGHIMPMGRAVIEETCKQMKRWERAIPSSRNLTMSINESPSQLIAPPNALRLKEYMEENGIEPSQIVVEVTESALMIDPVRAARNINLLHVFGVKVHMDDFGTGYSSLAYLHKFSFDALKIDRSFVSGEGDGLANPQIIETIIALARHLDLLVTAEGIETATQERNLRTLGCDTGQGYFISRPLSESAALAFIAADAEMGLQFHAATA